MAKLNRVDEINELWQEIIVCEKKIETEVLPIYREGLAKYIGEDISGDTDNLEIKLNDVFPIVQQKLPFLFFRRPRAFIKPRRKHVFVTKRNLETGQSERIRVEGQKLAKTTEAGINWSLHESGFEEEMDKISLDLALSPYAYLWQSYTGEFGIRQDETMFVKNESIFQKRIRPDCFLWDTEGTCEEEWRWMGRKVLTRLEDIIDDPRYNKIKEELDGSTGFGAKIKSKQGGDTRPLAFSDILSNTFKESMNAKREWLYEIWKKPNLKQRLRGEKGKVYVLAKGLEKPLLELDWPLKQEGFPGEIFRINPLNDTTPGIPDPKTYINLVNEKELETNYILKNLKQNSNLKVILNGAKFDREDVEKFMDGEESFIISKSPLQQGDVTSLQVGSVPAAAFQVAQNTDMQLQKQSAITAQRQGIKPPGEQTATQVEIQERGLESRPTVHQKLISRSLKKLARKRIQLMKQFFKKKDMVPILGTFDLEWSDEFSNQDITDEVDVEIDIQSMLPENPAVEIRNLLDMLQLMSQAISNPAVAQKIAQEGKVFNFSPFIEQMLLRMNLRDDEMFRPVRPEEGEGFTSNATLVEARRESVQAILQGQVEPPQEGEDHDTHLSVHESLLGLMGQIGIPQERLQALIQHVQQTKILQLKEEEGSGKRKEGTPISQGRIASGVPTRASEASRAQQRVQPA